MSKENVRANVAVNSERPKVGDLCSVRGLSCKVVKVHALGTIDVEAIEENKAFRVTGLSFI